MLGTQLLLESLFCGSVKIVSSPFSCHDQWISEPLSYLPASFWSAPKPNLVFLTAVSTLAHCTYPLAEWPRQPHQVSRGPLAQCWFPFPQENYSLKTPLCFQKRENSDVSSVNRPWLHKMKHEILMLIFKHWQSYSGKFWNKVSVTE